MAQLMATRNNQGIVLAADSNALDFDEQGNLLALKVDRLVQLGRSSAILAGGAAEAAGMAGALKTFIEEEGVDDIEDIYSAALPFLGSEYARFLRKRCQALELDPLLHVYFILAGYTAKDPQHPTRLYFIWTKKKLPQLDGDEILQAYTVPRRMGLEANLNQLSRANAGPEEILKKMKQGMETLQQQDDEVGPPFAYAVITKDGTRRLT
jgi:20S proteasome alpha/beta subunit